MATTRKSRLVEPAAVEIVVKPTRGRAEAKGMADPSTEFDANECERVLSLGAARLRELADLAEDFEGLQKVGARDECEYLIQEARLLLNPVRLESPE